MDTKNNQINLIVSAIILAGLMIAGAILLRGNSAPRDLSQMSPKFNACLDAGTYSQAVQNAAAEASKVDISGTPHGFIFYGNNLVATINGAEPLETVKQKLDKALTGNSPKIPNVQLDVRANKNVTLPEPALTLSDDNVLGNPQAKASLILYEDFQCPFCGMFVKQTEAALRDTYVKNGSVKLIYRDLAFLGPESVAAAEAARCAGEQGKFWDYHDYLFSHQMGENQGAFAADRLKTFAGTLGLK